MNCEDQHLFKIGLDGKKSKSISIVQSTLIELGIILSLKLIEKN